MSVTNDTSAASVTQPPAGRTPAAGPPLDDSASRPGYRERFRETG